MNFINTVYFSNELSISVLFIFLLIIGDLRHLFIHIVSLECTYNKLLISLITRKVQILIIAKLLRILFYIKLTIVLEFTCTGVWVLFLSINSRTKFPNCLLMANWKKWFLILPGRSAYHFNIKIYKYI